MTLFIRILVEADEPGSEAARALGKQLGHLLQTYAPVKLFNLEPYRKVPGWLDLSFLGKQAKSVTNGYQNLLQASQGWYQSESNDPSWAVWQKQDGQTFLLPEVRWAELQYWPNDV
jgi:hypothetical protein